MNAPSGNSYEVPSNGVITSWSFQNGATPVQGLKLKVGRPGGGTKFTIVGESVGGPQTANALVTKPARIAVLRRDYIGIFEASGMCQLATSSSNDIYGDYAGDPAVGSTSEAWPYSGNGRIPIQAKVEPDADADGFGDESQDRCPGTKGTADGCPPSSAPPTTNPGDPSAPPTPAPPPGDTSAPVFDAVRMTNTTFAVDTRGPAETLVTTRAKKGTTFVYSLSEVARVKFATQRKQSGRKVGTTCRKPSKTNRRRRRCTRWVSAGAFAQDGVAGPNEKPFSGRIGTKRLRPARYRVALSATDPAGNSSAPLRRLAFRVVRR